MSAPIRSRRMELIHTCYRITDIDRSVAFYEALGFEERARMPIRDEAINVFMGLPGDGDPRRGVYEIAAVAADWPREQSGASVADGVRFEMFVYVDELDRIVEELRDGGAAVLREPADMPWGERVAYVTDPDGNPVALAQTA